MPFIVSSSPATSAAASRKRPASSAGTATVIEYDATYSRADWSNHRLRPVVRRSSSRAPASRRALTSVAARSSTTCRALCGRRPARLHAEREHRPVRRRRGARRPRHRHRPHDLRARHAHGASQVANHLVARWEGGPGRISFPGSLFRRSSEHAHLHPESQRDPARVARRQRRRSRARPHVHRDRPRPARQAQADLRPAPRHRRPRRHRQRQEGRPDRGQGRARSASGATAATRAASSRRATASCSPASPRTPSARPSRACSRRARSAARC